MHYNINGLSYVTLLGNDVYRQEMTVFDNTHWRIGIVLYEVLLSQNVEISAIYHCQMLPCFFLSGFRVSKFLFYLPNNSTEFIHKFQFSHLTVMYKNVSHDYGKEFLIFISYYCWWFERYKTNTFPKSIHLNELFSVTFSYKSNQEPRF